MPSIHAISHQVEMQLQGLQPLPVLSMPALWCQSLHPHQSSQSSQSNKSNRSNRSNRSNQSIQSKQRNLPVLVPPVPPLDRLLCAGADLLRCSQSLHPGRAQARLEPHESQEARCLCQLRRDQLAREAIPILQGPGHQSVRLWLQRLRRIHLPLPVAHHHRLPRVRLFRRARTQR